MSHILLKEWPNTTSARNKRTKKPVLACRWGVNIRLQFTGEKTVIRNGSRSKKIGTVSKFISCEDFDKKYELTA